MAIVIRYMCCLVFISRSSDLIQYGGIVTKANTLCSGNGLRVRFLKSITIMRAVEAGGAKARSLAPATNGLNELKLFVQIALSEL